MSNLFDFCVGLINICLLLFLLYKLFGKAVKGAIAEREREARERVEEAQNMLKDAQSEFEKYEGLVNNLESKKQELLERAQREAQEYKEQTASRAKSEVDEIVSKVKSDMDDARRIVKAELRTEIAKATINQAKEILISNIDDSVHQNILEKFLTKVGG